MMRKLSRSLMLGVTLLLLPMPVLAQVSDCTGEPAGTLCDDTDGDVCTLAGCDGSGGCDQAFYGTLNNCGDTDGDPCTGAKCTGMSGAQAVCDQHAYNTSNLCPDTDDDPCTRAVCSGGECDQKGSAAFGADCDPGDGSPCTVGFCDEQGVCQPFKS